VLWNQLATVSRTDLQAAMCHLPNPCTFLAELLFLARRLMPAIFAFLTNAAIPLEWLHELAKGILTLPRS
jgi:hypothetical protein